MSFFSSKSKIVNTSPIPAGVRKSDAVALLHDHEFFLLCDPHHDSHKTLETELADPGDVDAARRHFNLPDSLQPLASTSTQQTPAVVQVYEVVDNMPNPVWSSNVVSREEFVDHGEGTWVRIKSPMGVVMETNWVIREKNNTQNNQDKNGNGSGNGGEGELELVEDVIINSPRLVMGIVKGQVDNNWRGIHKQIIEKLVQDAAAGAGAGAGSA